MEQLSMSSITIMMVQIEKIRKKITINFIRLTKPEFREKRIFENQINQLIAPSCILANHHILANNYDGNDDDEQYHLYQFLI